jgi:hypothetical protein
MKHIILLFDGTQNSAATGKYEDITNIFRLNLAISRHDRSGNPQIIFYMPGPGTRGYIDRQFGGATGQGIDEIIREAYVNIASNYSHGDLIYIFGFSRGAVAARALSCLIAESGLLKPRSLHLLQTAWRRFVNINRGANLYRGLQDLTADVHHGVRIKFMGLFDSVLGRNPAIPGHFSELRFSNQLASPIIDVGIHILSMDDNRSIFAPMLWDGFDKDAQHIEQIWVPGVHSDIGGTGKPHFIGMVTFFLMMSRIKDKTEIKINQEYISEINAHLTASNEISISNERYNFRMKFIPHKYRSVRSAGVQQYVHPIARIMHNMNILNRGKNGLYNGRHLVDFIALPTPHDEFTDFINERATIVLGYTPQN